MVVELFGDIEQLAARGGRGLGLVDKGQGENPASDANAALTCGILYASAAAP